MPGRRSRVAKKLVAREELGPVVGPMVAAPLSQSKAAAMRAALNLARARTGGAGR